MNKLGKILILILFMVFFTLVFMSTNGYYEQRMNKKLALTNDAIQRFEQDISEGKEIDINNYVDAKEPDYNNRVSNLGIEVSKQINNVFSKGISLLFKSIDKIIND